MIITEHGILIFITITFKGEMYDPLTQFLPRIFRGKEIIFPQIPQRVIFPLSFDFKTFYRDQISCACQGLAPVEVFQQPRTNVQGKDRL